MVAPASYTDTSARPTPQVEAQRLASALYQSLLMALPKRCATMTGPGRKDKYVDVKGHTFTVEDIRDHLRGDRTWATTLKTKDGMARSGCRDYDAGGEAVLLAALDAAKAKGITAFAIVLLGTDADHSGGHLWTLYARPAPVKDIRGQLYSLPGAKGEIYPSGNPVRLPLGLHRRKLTRGTLILQDGRRFDLDQPGQLTSGLRAILALRPNDAPPEATGNASTGGNGGSFGAYDAAHWQQPTEVHGRNLMASPRYQYLFKAKIQLTTLASGGRVLLERDGTADDSDSAQVAALVYNLVTSRRKGQAAGVGAPPESEIRAIALAWRTRLRPGISVEKYQAQIDYEIARYRPETYQPEATTRLSDGTQWGVTSLPESTTRRRGRPVGSQGAQRLARLDAICELLVEGTDVRRADLARATEKSARQIGDDLKTLQAMGRIELKRTRCGWRVLRVEGKIRATESGNYADFDAVQCDPFCLGDTPRGVGPSDAAVAADEPSISDERSVASLAESEPALTDTERTSAAGVSPLSAEPVLQPSTLAEAIHAALDNVRTRYQTLDQTTGELKPGKVTKQRVRTFVRETCGARWSDAVIDRELARERKERAWDSSIFQKERDIARVATFEQVKQRARSSGATYAKLAAKRHKKTGYWQIIAGIWSAEEATRVDRMEAQAATEQAELWEAYDQAVPVAPVVTPGKLPSVPERIRISRAAGARLKERYATTA